LGYIGQAPANKAVKTADIEDSAITAAKIADGTVVAGELASDSVTTVKILNANVTTAKIAADAITGAKIADDAIGAEHIDDNAIGLAALASGTDGNVISYDASGNPVAIATGSDGQVLTSAGAGQPPAFEAAAAGGKVLQVVSSQINGTTSSTSDVYTHILLSITPTLSSSKILVTITFGMGNATDGGGNSQAAMELKRGGTSGTVIIERTVVSGNNTDSNREGMQRATMQVLDSPSTTSSTEYGLYLKNTDGATYYVGAWGYSIGWLSPACVTLMEIGA
jgi:hypothetical protein